MNRNSGRCSSLLFIFSFLFSSYLMANDNPDFVALIKGTKDSLITEAYELVQQKIHEAEKRQQPEWNEQEGDDGNMAYDKAVVEDDDANEFIYRYLEFQAGDDSSIDSIREQIVKLTLFISELKQSIYEEQQTYAACVAKKEQNEELIAETDSNSALLNVYYLLKSQEQ